MSSSDERILALTYEDVWIEAGYVHIVVVRPEVTKLIDELSENDEFIHTCGVEVAVEDAATGYVSYDAVMTISPLGYTIGFRPPFNLEFVSDTLLNVVVPACTLRNLISCLVTWKETEGACLS